MMERHQTGARSHSMTRHHLLMSLLAATFFTGAACDSKPLDTTADGCRVEGKVYKAGETLPSKDGCNTCLCQPGGGVACTQRDCQGDAGTAGCVYGGRQYAVGAGFSSTDGCNTCSCQAGGLVACTERGCLPDAATLACTYNGKQYPVGASFASTDGCNTCGCSEAGVACTKKACPSTPDGGVGAGCRTDSDCRLFDDYCTGCDCRALGTAESDPKCSGAPVACLRAPCSDKVVACEAGKCVARAAQWVPTCGEPVCRGWTAKSGVPLCTTAKEGTSCATVGEECDPKDGCNRLLVCGGARAIICSVSRRDAKKDIHYLGADELREYRDDLMGMKLATWRYKEDPERARLGFIIDDLDARTIGVAADPARGVVDLYGYTSLAVATLQLQARQIAALEQELAELRRALSRRSAPTRH